MAFKAPARPGTYLITVPGDATAKPLTILVAQGGAAAPAPSVPGAAGPREIRLVANGLKWDTTTLALRGGEQVKFTIVNQDDEKHNLISPEVGLFAPESPDVSGGRTTSFLWTVPKTPGTYKFICIYHPAMVITVTVR